MENLKQVTKKNPKKVEAGKKGYQARLLKLKEEILAGTTGSNPGTISGTTGSNPGTISGTTVAYGICLIVILAVGLFYNFKKPTQAEQPEQIKKKIRPTL